jgi:ssDNA-binding replication factor A large subunit
MVSIAELSPNVSEVELIIAKVVRCGVVIEKRRKDGTCFTLTECVLGDQSGTITLSARNEQSRLCVPGNTVMMKRAHIEIHAGYMRLAVGRWGSIESAPDPLKMAVNTNNDLSLVLFEPLDDSNSSSW